MRDSEVRQLRQRAQRLWPPSARDPVDVVTGLVAVQAQEYLPAQWSVAQRIEPGSRPQASGVAAALDAGTVLRTHVMRPTWHFVAPSDARWLLELTAPRVHRLSESYYLTLGLDQAARVRTLGVLASAVAGGRHRTRAELGEALGAAGLPSSGLGLGYAIMHAELERVLISGAARGRQRRYAAFDERVPPAERPFDRDRALAELAARYFASRGPASVRDMAPWSGLTLTDCRAAVANANGAGLERAQLDDVELWFDPAIAAQPDAELPRAHLLQAYDEYGIAYTETRRYVLPAGYEAPRVPQIRPHTLLVDGVLAGRWGFTMKARGVTVVAQPIRRLTLDERDAVEAAAEPFGRFLAAPVTVEFDEP